AGAADRRPADCGGMHRRSPGQRVGCNAGPHFDGGGISVHKRTGGRCVPCRLDRDSGGGDWDAGDISAGHLSTRSLSTGKLSAEHAGRLSSQRMSKTYDSHGAKLSYWETGAGLPVIFLHPTPLDHDYWRPMIAALGEVRAIVPDFRGHGASELGTDLPVGGFARVPDAAVL